MSAVWNRSFIDVSFGNLIDMKYLYEEDLLNWTSINSGEFFERIEFGTMQYIYETLEKFLPIADMQIKPAHSKLERQALNLYFVWCSTYSEWTVVTSTEL